MRPTCPARSVSRSSSPTWAVEAVACYAEGDDSRQSYYRAAAAEAVYGHLTLERLNQLTYFDLSASDAYTFYARSFAVFDLLVQKTGGVRHALDVATAIGDRGPTDGLGQASIDPASFDREVATSIAAWFERDVVARRAAFERDLAARRAAFEREREVDARVLEPERARRGNREPVLGELAPGKGRGEPPVRTTEIRLDVGRIETADSRSSLPVWSPVRSRHQEDVSPVVARDPKSVPSSTRSTLLHDDSVSVEPPTLFFAAGLLLSTAVLSAALLLVLSRRRPSTQGTRPIVIVIHGERRVPGVRWRPRG